MAFNLILGVLAVVAATSAQNIGEFEGKNFFMSPVSMTRDAASTWCNMMGLKLLSIDSVEEYGYLKGVVSDHTSSNGFWTSAMKTDTFKWGNGAVVAPAYPITVENRSCVAFWGPALYSKDCEGVDGLDYFPLCQFKNARHA